MWVKLLKILVYIRYILPPVISKCVSSNIFPWSVFVSHLSARAPNYIAAVFTVAKMWKRPKCPLTGEWIKEWCMHTTEYHSVLNKETLPRVTMQRTHDAKRNEPIADGHTLWDSTYMKSKRVKLTESKARMVVARGWEKREMRYG